jgi:hypothetical protein
MPDKKFDTQHDPLSGPLSDTLPAGAIYGFDIVIEGTTATGETLTLDDIADSIRVNRDGTPIQNESYEYWNRVGQLWWGSLPEPSGNAAVDERVVARVLFSLPDFPNVLRIESDEIRYNIDFNSGTLTTRFDSNGATARILPIYAPALSERYQLVVRPDDKSFSGEGEDGESYNERNIARVHFQDPSDVVDRVYIEQGDRTAVQSITLDELNDDSGFFNRVENEVPTLVEWDGVFSLREQSLQKPAPLRYELQVSGAGTVEVTRMIAAPARG